MRTLLAAGALALACLIGATAAIAAPSARDPRVSPLQRQVRALQGQVQGLIQVVNQNADAANHNQDLADCRFVYQFRFNVGVLNIFSAMLGSSPYSGGFPSDNGACARAGMAPPVARYLANARSPFATLPYLLAGMIR